MGKSTRGRAPRKVPGEGLTESQARDLAAHLREALSKAEAERVFWAVRDWFPYGPRSATHDAQLEAAEARNDSKRVSGLARDLRRALAGTPPLWDTAGIDWKALDAVLCRVERSANAEATAPKRPRGPPALAWRDELVALVHAHYPPAKRKLSWSSHFEGTIALLLGYLGEDVDREDLHKQVGRILKRAPRAPFVLELL